MSRPVQTFNRIQSFVVFGGCKRHVVDDGGNMTKDGCVQQTRDDHHKKSKHFLVICFGCDVTKTDRGHACHCEIKRSKILTGDVWATSYNVF